MICQHWMTLVITRFILSERWGRLHLTGRGKAGHFPLKGSLVVYIWQEERKLIGHFLRGKREVCHFHLTERGKVGNFYLMGKRKVINFHPMWRGKVGHFHLMGKRKVSNFHLMWRGKVGHCHLMSHCGGFSLVEKQEKNI